jgi:hypothetical protein
MLSHDIIQRTMDDGERIYVTRTKPNLSREQKTAFGFVVGFGVLALLFGSFYMWKHVASPFVISYTGPQFLTGNEQQQQEMEQLKKEDTDADGIDDYTELYVYRTSPYLQDSDSDGANDAMEVTRGDDPNCAPSMPCAATAAEAINPTDLRGSFAEDVVTETAGATVPETPVTPAAIASTLAQMSTEELRALLIEAGSDEATVNTLTDEQLRTALVEALIDIQAGDTASAETDTTTSENSSTPSPAQQ